MATVRVKKPQLGLRFGASGHCGNTLELQLGRRGDYAQVTQPKNLH